MTRPAPPRKVHIDFGVVTRSLGQHAVKISAYAAAARFDSGSGRTFNFTRKQAEHVGKTFVALPEGAPAWAADPAELWRRCEAFERRGDAQTARIAEVAIPRDLPPEHHQDFARHIAEMWAADGMAVQGDIHDTAAADGGRNVHIHFQMTLRRFDGNTFADRKERRWNDEFRAPLDKSKSGAMKQTICDRANVWFAERGLECRIDWRDDPADKADAVPRERNVSKKAVEAWKHRPDSAAAAPFREVLDARETRQAYRKARRAERAWATEAHRLDTALRGIEDKIPGARPAGRRRGAAPTAWDTVWMPPLGSRYVESVEIRGRTALLSLAGGGAIVDRGDALALRGRVTDEALAAIAEQAARHGWGEVELTGDAAFRDRLAAAMQTRGIKTTNHGPASRMAVRQAEKVLAAERRVSEPTPTPATPMLAPARQVVVPRPHPAEPAPEPGYAPAYRPPWASGPRKPDAARRR